MVYGKHSELHDEQPSALRRCFAAVEQVIARGEWDKATAAFLLFRDAMCKHLDVEESILFPAFETQTGLTMGPTQVMRSEHAQMRQLLDASAKALAAKDAEEYSGCAETLLILAQQHNMKEEEYSLSDVRSASGGECRRSGRSVEECYGLSQELRK